MLYPRSQIKLTKELFAEPTSEYRGTPFWAWNNKLDKEELLWQIEQLKKMGFGGFHIHVRTGLATEYLGEEYMELVKSCIDKAREENMLVWLYDEDRWPSGAAGGMVTRKEEHRLRHLLLTSSPYGSCKEKMTYSGSSAKTHRTENGELIACYDVKLCAEGYLQSYCRINEQDSATGIKLFAYLETALPSPWYNNQTYVNTLDAGAISSFINKTHERYKEVIGEEFGNRIPSIFTDEPQFAHKQTLKFSHHMEDIVLPWTHDLFETYQDTYGDNNLFDKLPELLWDLPEEERSLVRYRYHDHIAQRFVEAFADQCGAWCKENGIMLTGHMMEESTLEGQTATLGEVMRSYRAFGLPGIDMLCDRREFLTAKQAQSAARQFGCPGVLSEIYGVTNWNFDFRGHKLQGDWQAALGITVRVPHLSWVSMNGEAKRDYPASFNYQSPWYEEYPYIENHYARINTVMTRGKAVCRIGVIHPIESYWLHFGVEENTQVVRKQMEDNVHNLTDWLLRGTIDFDFICESLLPEQCLVQDISDKSFPVSQMQYEVIIVPPIETIRSTTLERLVAFRNKGGKVIFLGEAPKLVDAIPSNEGIKLWNESEKCILNQHALLNILEELRELDIRQSNGARTEKLIYQMRQEADARWLFIAQADKEEAYGKIIGDIYTIRIPGRYKVELYHTLRGDITPIRVTWENGWTVFTYPLYEHDSLLFRLEYTREDISTALNPVSTQSLQDANKEGQIRFLNSVPVTLHEPNVLLLDMAEYALDDEPYASREEILRIDNLLRKKLKWPLRSESITQPWVENDTSTPHCIRLKYVIHSELTVLKSVLALENADIAVVTLNGCQAKLNNSWYVDKSIGRMDLPDLHPGENILEIQYPYGKSISIEVAYLLGDFGVRVEGCQCTLISPVKKLPFGDITRYGLPFYGGNITYHLTVETVEDTLQIYIPCYHGQMLRVFVDGQDKGILAFSPYQITISNLSDGKHAIDLRLYGCRINTFGQLHNNDRVNQWWGPDSWRTSGTGWSYEYVLWPQGIMKSPEIFITSQDTQ